MLSSRLFWRVFAVYAGLTFCSALAFALILTARHRDSVLDQVHHRLRDNAETVQSLLSRGYFAHPITDRAERHLVQLTGVDGATLHVLFNPQRGEHTREMELADETGSGFAERNDPQSGKPFLYYALALTAGEHHPRGYIIAALPMATIRAELQSVTSRVWETAILVSLVVLGVTYLVVSRIIRPLETLTQAAQQLTAGELPPEFSVIPHNEIGTLALAFNSMSRQLSARIIELQQQSLQREQNAEQLATVLKSMVEGVIAVDGQERVLIANDAAIRLLELKPQSIVNRPIWEAVRHPQIQQLVRETLATGELKQGEFDVPRTQSVVQMVATQLPASPTPGVLLVLHDITDLRRLENMRREFVSNVSHELKTPLTSITAYTETLLDGAIDDQETNRFFLTRIEEQAERLHTLILDLLDLARMEQGIAAFEPGPVDIRPVVETSVTAHQGVADSKQVQLRMHGPQEPVMSIADAEGVRTILDNLLDNAINYTPAGGAVTVRYGAEDGQWVAIDVQDTGVGIAKEHQNRIFERFYRIDKARSRELGGTGLGLSIVKHLCQMFGGSVKVISQPGHGSTFCVRLPISGETHVGPATKTI